MACSDYPVYNGSLSSPSQVNSLTLLYIFFFLSYITEIYTHICMIYIIYDKLYIMYNTSCTYTHVHTCICPLQLERKHYESRDSVLISAVILVLNRAFDVSVLNSAWRVTIPCILWMAPTEKSDEKRSHSAISELDTSIYLCIHAVFFKRSRTLRHSMRSGNLPWRRWELQMCMLTPSLTKLSGPKE